MANEKRLIDANALIGAIDEYMKVAYDCPLSEAEDFRKKANSYRVACFVEGLYEATELIEEAPTVDAVEVVRIEEVKQEILQQMDMFIAEYRRISESYVDHFGGKADAMEVARRLVNAALTDLAKTDGGNEDG